MSRLSAVSTCLVISLGFGCAGTEIATSDESALTAERCIVLIHGKGGSGSPTRVEDGIAIVSPTGNGRGWGGAEWRYATDADRREGIASVVSAVEASRCRRVVLHGFSNGASMVAAVLCAGEDLDGRLLGVVIDDPVTDAATEGCEAADVPVAL